MSTTDLARVGVDWLAEQVEALTDHLDRVGPVEFNEQHRYLPESVSSIPGFIRFAVNPYMREIVECFDVDSPVREVNLKKGAQVTYTTALESGILYYAAHVRVVSVLYMTADKELAAARIENNILPMFNASGFADIIRSSDTESKHKTGKTKSHIQWEGGGSLIPFGARNADKMRQISVPVILKDEIDAWPDDVGGNGDPDSLSDARASFYWERRKIFRGSTPLLEGSSKIERAYLRGDQREYHVRCRACNAPQPLRWYGVNDEGLVHGFAWDLDDGVLVPDSVRWLCSRCGHEHFEHDKERLYSPDEGAAWVPTARPVEPGIRSYHLPALYSPAGALPWAKCVADWLDAYDVAKGVPKDHGKLQVFYNNVLAEPWRMSGLRIELTAVSAHRRACYALGQVPNRHSEQWCGSPVLFLTCAVDVHKSNLAVAVWGWTRDARCYLVNYWRLEDEDCERTDSPVWSRLREVVEEREWVADDGARYRLVLTLVDAGWSHDTVLAFCGDYDSGVYPVLGRERTAKHQRIQEFAEFKTQAGTVGYRILVDHYKDRLAPVLRREWNEAAGQQRRYHFNAPVDLPDSALAELTREFRREKRDERGAVSYQWHRPGNVPNELWDLLVYGHASVEILAWSICVRQFGLETVDWPRFWDWVEGGKVFSA